MVKYKHLKVKGFLNFLYETEIHAVPKTQEKWISVAQEKHGKHKHSKFMGFFNILGEAEIHIIPRTWEKWIYIIQGKKWGNTEISHILRYLADLELMRTQGIPNVW